MTESQEIAAIHKILDFAGVKRVIAIDDMYALNAPVADAIAAINMLEPDVANSVFRDFSDVDVTDVDFSGDPEVRDDLLRERWGQISQERRVQIVQELRMKSSAEDDTDKSTKDSLGRLFGTREFQTFSLKSWTAQKERVLADKDLALLLIDEDFSKEDGSSTQGLQIVTEVLKSTSDSQAFCALLSHKYTIENIDSQWEKLADEQGFDKSRFVLIPKEAIDTDPAAFARLIKLATMSKPIDELRRLVTKILLESLDDARKNVEKINLYDMDEIVFRSSWQEGAWEPETLLRVFAIFHRRRTKALAMGNDELHKVAARVRSASRIETESPKSPNHKIWPIQRLEIFEDADYLNALHLPIEVGDIFEKDGGKRLILIAPSCDLVVRSKGFRADSVREVMLAPITGEPPQTVTWEVPFYSISTRHFIDFKKAFSVKLLGLDLCVFNKNGSAELQVGRKPPENLIPSWNRHYAALQQILESIFKLIEDSKATKQQRVWLEQALGRIDYTGNFSPTFIPATKTLKYNFRRVERLLSPRTESLMSAYTQYLSRSAFEHELETKKEG